jgi:phage terminase large subunit
MLPGKKNAPMKLTLKQTKALDILEDTQTTELLYGGGAGGGKSALGCYWLLKNCLKYPGTRWVMGRSKLKSLKETTLNTFFEICKLQGINTDLYRYNQQDNIIHFANGSQVILKDLFLYPSDPNFDSLGSLEITGAFVDECNQIVQKAWQILKSRIRYKLDEYNLIPKMLGSCNPAKSWVYTYFYKPFKDGILEPFKSFIQSLLSDNPYVSKHYEQNLLTLDKASKERLLLGNWEYDDDPAALCEYDRITDLFSNDFSALHGPKYITADIARFGSDKVVVGLWHGFRVKIKTFSKQSITDSYEYIKRLQKENGVPLSHIIVDEDGVGGGLVDMLKCKGFVNNSRALPNPLEKDYSKRNTPENYENLQAQCAFRMAERINQNGLYIENATPQQQQEICEELEALKQKNMDSDGRKGIVGKDDVKKLIGRSPDYRDMLLMREYFELKPVHQNNLSALSALR